MHDEFDIGLLRICRAKAGQQLNEVIKPFLGKGVGKRSERTLRRRLNRLVEEGLIRLDRETYRGRVLCYLEEAGEKLLLGQDTRDQPLDGGRSQ